MRKIVLALLAAACAMLCAGVCAAEEAPDRSGGLIAEISAPERWDDCGVLRRRYYEMKNEDQVEFSSYIPSKDAAEPRPIRTVFVPADSTLHLVTADRTGWQTRAPAPGNFTTSFLLVESREHHLMCYAPQRWELLENGSRRYLGLGSFTMTECQNGNFLLTMGVPAMERGQTADFTLVRSGEPLMNWEDLGVPELWAGYDNLGVGRWGTDGYYWPSYGNYVPTGRQVYFQMPCAYICRSLLAQVCCSRLAEDLSVCMLETMGRRQNDLGFVPTSAGSQWLLGDYGIGAGFYDTRFNTDLMVMFLDGYALSGQPQFLRTLHRYGDFILDYASGHSRITEQGGLLLEDYCHPDGNLPTHTSLNHQLAQILLLERMAEVLDRPALGALAEQMLLAVEDTETGWIQSNGNLHYAVYPDGSFGGLDYPYLTYDDLFRMQAYLTHTLQQPRNESLDRLMAAKQQWMDANGITAYLKS